jgi:hypothetical protein
LRAKDSTARETRVMECAYFCLRDETRIGRDETRSVQKSQVWQRTDPQRQRLSAFLTVFPLQRLDDACRQNVGYIVPDKWLISRDRCFDQFHRRSRTAIAKSDLSQHRYRSFPRLRLVSKRNLNCVFMDGQVCCSFQLSDTPRMPRGSVKKL